jgi:NAD(P)H-dependent flavin oxidoreductase YrpB (nitropropane dioxygenase family)
MENLERFAWTIAVIITLGIGIYAGYKITAAIKDPQIIKLEEELKVVEKKTAKANAEQAFWQETLRGLAEGGQLEGVDFKGRPSKGD